MILDSYWIEADGIKVKITIKKTAEDYVPIYELKAPELAESTKAFLNEEKEELFTRVNITSSDLIDPNKAKGLRKKLLEAGREIAKEKLRVSDEESIQIAAALVHSLLGLGRAEFFLYDDEIEEITINRSDEPVWVYHKKHGWLKTNVFTGGEEQNINFASATARQVGRQINTQNPLLDAYLPTGDRLNATLYPISTSGSTITIRKFARKPWTITDFLKNKTLDYTTATLLWSAIQYEMSVLISGGTGSGKTSILNVLMAFTPPNHRTISIEQTKEIRLPKHLQWVPLVVREEGRGKQGITMLDLMVNSLRMRPDRIIVGEVRRAEEAQVMFEAMHTGHAVYATLHAETVEETMRRLNNAPISIPSVMLESLNLILCMYRDRKSGIRRVYEVGEIIPSEREEKASSNVLYRWRAFKDKIEEEDSNSRFKEDLKRYSRMNDVEIEKDFAEKKMILKWLVKKELTQVDEVGKIFAEYYSNKKGLLEKVKK